MTQVTQILSRIESGDRTAAPQLLALVYDELRRLAALRIAQEKPGQTLQATALVHEAYLRLVDGKHSKNWDSRGHFFAAAAEAMRRILVDNARRKKTAKRGGQFDRVDLNDAHLVAGDRHIDLIALDEALEKLAALEPRKAQLVNLRFFAGLSVDQAADALGISASTAGADWAYAKSWLKVCLGD